ncbi:MAG: hypothetical protein VX699_11605, partial [Myxococcota bacterium]|nr:hypothetical protein [Myxococcota bacterium]
MFDDTVSCVDAPMIARWRCPTPWRAGKEVNGEHPVVCQPPEKPSQCGPGEHAHPGNEGCVRAGSPCPPGGWHAIEDEGEFVLYVKPGGMGDGMSPDQPLGDIQTAHNLAIQGSIILVAPGTYTTPLFINKEVTLIGACSEATKIAPPQSAKGDAISVISPTTIKNFTISGGRWGVFVKSSGVTTLEGLVIEGVRLGAVSVFGDGLSTQLVLKDSAVRDIQ